MFDVNVKKNVTEKGRRGPNQVWGSVQTDSLDCSKSVAIVRRMYALHQTNININWTIQ